MTDPNQPANGAYETLQIIKRLRAECERLANKYEPCPDDMHQIAMGRYGRMRMCHMIADTIEELHQMADRIGIDRNHYQGPPKTINPHYDICTSKRSKAVDFGASEITVPRIGYETSHPPAHRNR